MTTNDKTREALAGEFAMSKFASSSDRCRALFDEVLRLRAALASTPAQPPVLDDTILTGIPTDARDLLRTFLDKAVKAGITHLNPAEPERAEVRPPVHADTERLDFIVSNVEGNEYGWWLPDWCIKVGDHKPSSCEVRDSIDTRRGITTPSAADSAQGGATGGGPPMSTAPTPTGYAAKIESLIAERDALASCLRVAMEEWAGWLDESRGVAPESEEWEQCVATLGEDPLNPAADSAQGQQQGEA